MTKKRIVVTGMGVISCFGTDVEQYYDALLEGKSGIVPITEFPCEDYPTRFAGVIRNFDSGDYVDKKLARRTDKFITYAITAGKKALEMGGFNLQDLGKLDKTRCGIIIGSGIGGMTVFNDGVVDLVQKGHRRVTPFFIPYVLTNMASGLLAVDLGFMGPNYSISTACATSNNSIIAAANHIRNGDADLMLCGGVEAPILAIGLAGFCACKALSQRNDAPEKASRPFDKDRDGFVMGEGGGVLLLESLDHALARGAPILAEYLGGGISCDAHHMTEPRPDGSGVALCVRNALRDANIAPEDINLINAHATSTPAGDIAEVRALKSIFAHPEKIIVNATKSMTGHALGGAGGLEAVATIQGIRREMVHPTINVEHMEPEMTFRVTHKAEKLKIKAALSNSFGFGGHNASIVLAPYAS